MVTYPITKELRMYYNSLDIPESVERMKKLTLFLILYMFFSLPGFCLSKSKDYCLYKSYVYYKRTFISPEGRVMDPQRGDITTSEGQSYIMFRAVVHNDREMFDKTYNWTKKNLQQSTKLFAWIWGKDKHGKYRVLDRNSAADADVNIAFALISAYEKWKDEKYLDEALPIIRSIWRNDTRKIGKRRVLMPGFVQARSDRIEVNPSYFHPYAFRFFAKYDDWHDWRKIIDSSYYYILESSSKTATGLPPNWFLIEKGKVVLEDGVRSDFSYDAIRVLKKYYWDYVRTGDMRDLKILAKAKFFIPKWRESHMLYTNYTKDGDLRDYNEFTGGIAILVLPISMYDPAVAEEIFRTKVTPYLYKKENWKTRNDYYCKNLLWYGCRFYFKDTEESRAIGKLPKEVLNNTKECGWDEKLIINLKALKDKIKGFFVKLFMLKRG